MTENNESEKSLTSQLEEKIKSLEAEHKNLLTEKQSNDERYDLVASILNAKPRSFAALEEFKRLVREDYREFAAKENSFADEAGILLALQDVITQLEEVAQHPTIVKKQVIAIGGGFSSGKSSFINSLFVEGSPLLPTHINPATAIPAFVSYSEKNSICGYATNGGAVPLTMELYKKLSHNYLEQFKFNLKDQLSFVSITAKMNKEYTHLCFIDTPGFNAASAAGNQTADDMDIARSYLSHADALIWVLGIDSTGTFDRESIDFLGNLVNNGSVKKLFIVLNKCDLKPEIEVLAIMEELTRCLDDANIKYEGLAAYSSRRAKEYAYIESYNSFDEFLAKINQPKNNKQIDIIRKINKHLNEYHVAFNLAIEYEQGLKKKQIETESDDKILNSSFYSAKDDQAVDINKFIDELGSSYNIALSEQRYSIYLKIIEGLRNDGSKSEYEINSILNKQIQDEGSKLWGEIFTAKIEELKKTKSLGWLQEFVIIVEKINWYETDFELNLVTTMIAEIDKLKIWLQKKNNLLSIITQSTHEENLATLEKLRNNMTQTVDLLFAEIQMAEVLSV